MIYEALCPACSCGFEYTATVANRNIVPDCPLCGTASQKVIRTATAGHVTGKFQPFRSMIDGTIIQTQRDLESHNKRHNVALLNDGYSDEQIKNLKPKQHRVDKQELVQDLVLATDAVTNGYRPTVQVQDDD